MWPLASVCFRIPQVMESINMAPTDDMISKMIGEADADKDGAVNEAEFVAMMSRQVAGADSEADIIEAFKILAGPTTGGRGGSVHGGCGGGGALGRWVGCVARPGAGRG